MLKKLLLLLLICSCFVSCSKNDNVEDLYEEVPVSVNITAEDTKLLNMVNAYRAARNLQTLQLSTNATVEASSHSKYMIKMSAISHANWDERAAKVGESEKATAVSENVARNTAVEKAFWNWIESENGHKQTIIGDFTHTGVSVIKSDDGFYYFTQIFLKK